MKTRSEILDLVRFYVERDNLNKKNRKREIIYKKCFLQHKLREHKFTYAIIGELFNQHHASIIHNVKTHKDMIKFNADFYEPMVSEYIEAFKNTEYIEPVRNLLDDIKDCYNIPQLNRIKRWIAEKKYDTNTTILT